MTSTEKMLRELIALPSVNPAFLPAKSPYAGEHRVVEYLAATASKAGLEVKLQRVAPNRSNVLATLRAKGKKRQRIVLAPHTDTVGGAELPGNHFQPQARNGRLYGRGACDTKGSVAAMLSAVLELASSRNRPSQTEIVFAALVDEESGQAGSRALGASGFKADLAIVGEPTLCKVVTAHKGLLWLNFETRGKAAHGARPELGRNAVHLMARIVDRLETDYAKRLRRRRHPLLGSATLNVGTIRGGSQPNIVPDACSMSADRRLLPGETPATVIREIKAFLQENELPAAISRVHNSSCLPLETRPNLRLVSHLLSMVGQKVPLGVDYFSDAGVLADFGIPGILFGPGDIAQAHTPDEWIEVAQLERAKKMLVEFLKSLP